MVDVTTGQMRRTDRRNEVITDELVVTYMNIMIKKCPEYL